MEINFDSAAALPIINVPAKKVSRQGTPLTREMIGLPCIIKYSMVYTHTSWSLRKSPPPPKCSLGHISYEISPPWLYLWQFGPEL